MRQRQEQVLLHRHGGGGGIPDPREGMTAQPGYREPESTSVEQQLRERAIGLLGWVDDGRHGFVTTAGLLDRVEQMVQISPMPSLVELAARLRSMSDENRPMRMKDALALLRPAVLPLAGF